MASSGSSLILGLPVSDFRYEVVAPVWIRTCDLLTVDRQRLRASPPSALRTEREETQRERETLRRAKLDVDEVAADSMAEPVMVIKDAEEPSTSS